MNLKRSVFLLSLLTGFLVSESSAGPFALFGSIQTTHSAVFPTGGLRLSLNDDVCIDVTLGAMAGYDDVTI